MAFITQLKSLILDATRSLFQSTKNTRALIHQNRIKLNVRLACSAEVWLSAF